MAEPASIKKKIRVPKADPLAPAIDILLDEIVILEAEVKRLIVLVHLASSYAPNARIRDELRRMSNRKGQK